MNGKELVFVYGTLRKGASNHWRMEGAELVGSGRVAGALYRIGWYPGLLPDPGAGPVAGEVYRVSAPLLEELDDFEGSEFERVRVAVHPEGTAGPSLVWVWGYRGPVDETRRITGGDWLEVADC